MGDARRGEKNGMYGKKHSEETKNKIAEKRSIPVICIETGEVFKNAKEAAQKTSASQDGIYDACKGKLKTSGGLHWKYKEDLNELGRLW